MEGTRQTREKESSFLEIEDLYVTYQTPGSLINALNGVSLTLSRGELYGIVGESGCGKSTLAYAIMRYLGKNGTIDRGQITFQGQNLAEVPISEMEAIWGKQMAMVYQDPNSALNPSLKVGEQISEVLTAHYDVSSNEAWGRAVTMLERVQIRDPRSVARVYPHQLSGGMMQRVCLAMSLIGRPELLILDEPTTNLDVTTEAKILDILNELKRSFETTFLYITHDLGIVAHICDWVEVMYAGEIVEESDVSELYSSPLHPYTKGLLSCIPNPENRNNAGEQLQPIPGKMVDLTNLPRGCSFNTRCPYRKEKCYEEDPPLVLRGSLHKASCHFAPLGPEDKTVESIELYSEDSFPWSPPVSGGPDEPLLQVDGVAKHFAEDGLWSFWDSNEEVKAVNGVSFSLSQSQTLGVVGESGSGKTTLARAIAGLTRINEGRISFKSKDISVPLSGRDNKILKKIQIVFQDPTTTLNPKKSVEQTLARPLKIHGDFRRDEIRPNLISLLQAVGLEEKFLSRYPSQLSGGEKQRVAIARAFVSNPDLILCDEPTSSLDVSVQATILNLLLDLQDRSRTAYLFISHDLSVVSRVADSIAVMYLGEIVELASTRDLFFQPHHPYTEALLSSIHIADPEHETNRIILEGEVPSPINPPAGCTFHPRCPYAEPVCRTRVPDLRDVEDGRFAHCHFALELDLAGL